MANEIEFNLTGFKVKHLQELEGVGQGHAPVTEMVRVLGQWAVGGADCIAELDIELLPGVARQLSATIAARMNPDDAATGKN